MMNYNAVVRLVSGRVSVVRAGDEHPITNEQLEKVQLRLVHATADLDTRRLPSLPEIEQRIRAVVDELREIQEDLRVVLHAVHLEEGDIDGRLAEIEAAIERGDDLKGRDASEVIADLRARYGA